MTDYLTLTEFIPGTKAKAQEINANFAAVKDAINSKAAVEGDGTKTFSVANATTDKQAVNKSQLDSASISSDKKAEGLINRFCILSGNLTNGESDILSYSSTTLSFKIGGSYPETIWRSANGTQETISTLANITGLSNNGTYTVLKELGATNAFATSSKVTQGKIYPTSPVDGDYHCLNATELKTYKRISGAWVETQYIALGKITVAGGVITSATTTPYFQNGYSVNSQTQGIGIQQWISAETAFVQGGYVSVNHNLNLSNPKNIKFDCVLICKTAEYTFQVGDVITNFTSSADLREQFELTLRTNSIKTGIIGSIVAASDSIYYPVLTPANWRIIFRIWY